MAKYILFSGGNGYCGCDFEDVLFYPNDVDENQIDADGWAMAEDNATTYSHIHFGWGEDYTDEEWEEFYSGDDGNFTFFIDLVDGTFSKNSLASEKFPIMNSVDDMFHFIRNRR